MSQKTLKTHGLRRGFRVRVFTDGIYVRIQWRENGQRKTESRPNTAAGRKEAKAWAEAFYQARTAPPALAGQAAPLTLRKLWEAYWTAEADHLREVTQGNYARQWAKFETFAGREKAANLITQETLDEFKADMIKIGHEPDQARRHIAMVKRVFFFGIHRKLIAANGLTAYRFKRSRDAAPNEMAEYTPAESAALIAQFNPRSSAHWRPYVLTVLLTYCGPRINAARQLEWRDIDLDAGTVRYRPELDKMGKDRTQPLPVPVVEALYVAYGWRLAYGYQGPFVFWGGNEKSRDKGRPYHATSYFMALKRAEERAGIPHVAFRAAHALRRGAAGTVEELTGSTQTALNWIGDEDSPAMRKRYLKKRDNRMVAVAHQIGSALPISTDNEATTTPAPDYRGRHRLSIKRVNR